MKSIFLVLIITCALLSCSKDEKFDIKEYPQKWQLVKMTGQFPDSETTGDNMEWQEYYFLNSDGTFTKHRDQDGNQTEASGTFSFVDKTDGKFLDLVYDANSELIGSCYANLTENLWLISDSKLLGTWSYCDGPGLEYERVE